MYNKHKRTLKGEEKKADQLVILELKEWHSSEFTEFFHLTCPKFNVEEANNLEMPMGADRNSPSKSLLSVTKGPRKGQKILRQ